jgi:hypothetical protein
MFISPWRLSFDSRPFYKIFVVDNVTLGRVFFRVTISQLLHTHLHLHVVVTTRTNGRSVGTFQKDITFDRKLGNIGQTVIICSLWSVDTELTLRGKQVQKQLQIHANLPWNIPDIAVTACLLLCVCNYTGHTHAHGRGASDGVSATQWSVENSVSSHWHMEHVKVGGHGVNRTNRNISTAALAYVFQSRSLVSKF